MVFTSEELLGVIFQVFDLILIRGEDPKQLLTQLKLPNLHFLGSGDVSLVKVIKIHPKELTTRISVL